MTTTPNQQTADPDQVIAAELRETNRLLALIAERLGMLIDRAASPVQAQAQPATPVRRTYVTMAQR